MDSTSFSSVKYHGLCYRGATGYLNSVLQVLFMTEDFRAAVERHTSEPDTEFIDCDLKTLFADLKKYTAYTFNITKKLGIDRVTEQRDAAECFEKILNLTSPDASKIFQGQLTHTTTCSTCHSETEAGGGFWHLPLTLTDSYSEDYDVVQGIKEHFSISDFSGEKQMYCDRCEAISDATIKCVMKHHPDVLVLLLKRFQFDRYKICVKINQRVNVPYTLQIPEDQTYELYAVVDHHGVRFGRYTATIRDNESWYEFNDTIVRKPYFQPFQVDTFERSSTAYLLFYRKMNAPAVDTQDNRNMSPPESFPPATSDDQSQDAEKMKERKEADGATEVVHDTAMHVPVEQSLKTAVKEIDSNKHARSQEGVIGEAQGRVKDEETDKDGQTGGDEESEKEEKSSTEYSGDREGSHDVRGNINEDLRDKQALGGDRGSEPCSAERMDVDMKKGPTGVQGDTPLTYHGLLNQGATCYLNSVLQVLFMTEDFRAAVERHTSEPDTERIDRDLKTLFADLKQYTASAFNITKKLGIERVTEQRDAAECFEKILNLTSPDASKIFQGQLTHRTTCSTCHSETEADGRFWHLSLTLTDSYSEDYSVVQGIKEHFSISDFSGENQMYCDRCEAKSDATIECVMKHHPDVLMLLLKRFQFDRYMKIDQRVNVPYTLQIPEGQTYELYAVVDHDGSLRFGSYTATIRDNESWYEFNDDRVTKPYLQPFQAGNFERSRTAYLLFYKKKNAAAADTQDNRNMSPPESLPPATSDDQSQDAEKMKERKEADGATEVVHDTAMHVPVEQSLETAVKEIDSNVHARSQEGVIGEAQGGVKDVETDKDGQTGGDEESEKEEKSSTEYSGDREGSHDVRGNINEDLGDKQALGGDRGSEPCSAERMDVDMKKGPTGVQGDTPLTYHGLLNLGATCYLNSVLQVLFMTEDFREAVQRHTSEADTERIDCDLKTLFADLKQYTAYTFNITKKLGIDRVTEQRDAAEYFEKILNLTSPDASQIFRGQLTHRTTCSTCHSETEADGRFWHLPLTLADSYSEDYKVVQGIKEHFTGTDFSGEDQMYCDTCEAKSDATIECVMKHHPDVLMLLLKRFQFDYRYMTYVKINQTVNVPYTLQIPEDQMYELYAVVDHHGSLRGGHYTATVRDNESWYEFNDDRVTKLYYQPFQEDTFERSSTAYLLFYRKMNAAAADTQDNRNMSPPESFPPATSDDQSQDAEKVEERKDADGEKEVVHDTAMHVPVEQSLETAVKETDSNVHARSKEGVIGEAQGGVKDEETDKDGQTGGDEESEKEGKSSTEYSGDREGSHDVRGNINEDLGDKQALGGDRGSEPCSAERMDVDMKKGPTGVQGDGNLFKIHDLCTSSFETQHSRRDGEKRGDHQHPLERETSERLGHFGQSVKDQTSEKHRPEQEISATTTRLGDVGELRQQEDQRDKHVENPSGELTASQEVGTVEMTRRGNTESKTRPEFNEDTEGGKPGSGIIVKTTEEESKGFQTTRYTTYIRLKTSQNGTKGQVK